MRFVISATWILIVFTILAAQGSCGGGRPTYYWTYDGIAHSVTLGPER